jgi:hypothetical protein
VSDLKARCSELPALRDEQRQLSADASEAERLAALNSELRLRNLDLGSLQQEAERLGPLAEEAQMLKQQLEEMKEDAAELPLVKVGHGWVLWWCACVAGTWAQVVARTALDGSTGSCLTQMQGPKLV